MKIILLRMFMMKRYGIVLHPAADVQEDNTSSTVVTEHVEII